MPSRSFRPCTHPGCGALVNGAHSKCETHRKQAQREEFARRDKATHALYGAAWRRAREAFLRRHPLCIGEECKRDGRLAPATVVDHIEPHRGDRAKFWDSSNWQPLCKPCHDSKTAREDGGFGNPSRTG